MSHYEKVLQDLGPFGPFQRRVFVLVSLFETPVAWAMLLPIFLGRKTSWKCESQSASTEGNFSIAGNFSTSQNSSYHQNVTSYDDSPGKCNMDGTPCPGIIFADEFTSIISEWNLVCDRASIPGHITTIQMCGVLVGALITGQIADLIGRRKTLFCTYILLLIFSLGSAFVASWEVFAVMRFMIGALVGGVMVVNFVLPLEFVTPRWRTFCGCIGFWAVGLMTLALWAYYIRDWRYLIICTSLSGIFILLTWWFIPESPRWLLTKGRFEEAEKILKKIAKCNNRELPDMNILKSFAEREQKLREERSLYSYNDLFKSWKLARNTLIVMYGWFVSSAVYYGLNFITGDLTGDLYRNVLVSGFVEIPALIFVVGVNNRIGRRKTISFLMILAGISCFSVFIISLSGKSQSLSVLSVVFAMIGKSGISGGWAATQVFSAETFPTVIRNIGVASCSMAARLGGIAAPQLVLLGSSSKVIPFTIFGILAALYGILVLFLPETSGQPLPDDIHTSNVQANGDIERGGHESVPLQKTES
ncbi:hypothetical protein FSP39_005624 [Pinctada imbricata]|uniref:Major facilitator superfamily (MFS) profile domain-containing protein n=1 Tax=Pinctada imbricata TaxID=66713 RepID=A0AA89BUY9_PINIB|nr:hypothetical protein FSP39_005624 [Pinctada imbricata]